MGNTYCDKCSMKIDDGYVIHDGIYHYCEKCLHEVVGKTEYEKLYEMGYAFWTTFED